MLTRAKAYNISYYTLWVALATLLTLPAGFTLTQKVSDMAWSLQDEINYLVGALFVATICLLCSLVTSAYAKKDHPRAAFWFWPLAAIFACVVFGGLYGLYIYLFDPFG